jgi:hypothetical protein
VKPHAHRSDAAGAAPIAAPAARSRRVVLRVIELVLVGVLAVIGAWWGVVTISERNQTERTTARFDPPVWAGQNVPGACSGGFYARRGNTIVITIVGHCAVPGTTLRGFGGRTIGVFGPRATVADCPAGHLCFASDFLTLALAADRVPWGHLNMVDMGAGGYRTMDPGTRALGCGDMAAGQHVEVDGREHYRAGTVLAINPYDTDDDVNFPCMVVTDIPPAVGDSGGAVLVDGRPAGVISRDINGHLGFTPLAEGLENLGLVLCTTPACDLSPERAEQPSP